MSYAPIAFTIPQYEDYPNYWLKAYEQGTVTPLSMATDSTGGTLAAKLELDTQGFPKTAGGARLIPFIDGDYDLWLFPTAAEADANDTSNAIQFADNLNTFAGGIDNSIVVADKATAAALSLTLTDAGMKIFIVSADGGEFTVRYNATPATYSDDGGSYTGTQFIPSGGDGTIGIVRDYFGAVNVTWFGAVGDGTTNDSDSIKTCIQAAIDKTSAVLGSVERSSPTIAFNAGVYIVGNNVFGSYTETDVRTIEFIGQGMYNTSIVLNEIGAMGHYTATSKILFPVFRDIGFYGDTFLDTAAADATNPVSSLRKFVHCNSSTGVQGFAHYNCLFSRFGETYVFEGVNNEAENQWFGCKATKIGDWLVLSNNQSFNHDHYSCDIEQYVGSLVRIPSADYSGDGGQVSGGASVRFFGGSYIPLDEGSQRYLVEINKGSGLNDLPTVLFNGARIELRYDNNGIASIATLVNGRAQFNDCSFLLAFGVGGTKRLVSVGAYGRVQFNRCYLAETGTAATKEWYLIGVAGFGENGSITFDECSGAVIDPDDVVLGAEDTFHGIVTAKNTITYNFGVATEDSRILDWSIADGWWKYHGKVPNVPPMHKAKLMQVYAPYNALSPQVIVLPEDAVIIRVVGYIPPQGTSAAAITYSLDDGDAVNLFTEVVAQQQTGVFFEKTPADFATLDQGVIGSTINERTLTFSANAGAHQLIRGFGYIEYY